MRPVLVAGMACCAAGLTLLAALGMSTDGESFLLSLAPGLVVCGLGLGLAFVSLTVTAIPGGQETGADGVASGLYNTALQVGGAIGIAVLAAISTSRADRLQAVGRTAAEAITSGRTVALLVAAGLMLAGVALACMLPSGAGRVSTSDTQ